MKKKSYFQYFVQKLLQNICIHCSRFEKKNISNNSSRNGCNLFFLLVAFSELFYIKYLLYKKVNVYVFIF